MYRLFNKSPHSTDIEVGLCGISKIEYKNTLNN